MKNLIPFILIFNILVTAFANYTASKVETAIPFSQEQFTLVADQNLVLDHYVYSLDQRPKRLYKDTDGRYWMIHGGQLNRQHIAGYLSSGLYSIFLGNKVACEYKLMVNPKGQYLMGSPFIIDFETLANYSALRHNAQNNHENLINAFFQKNKANIQGLERLIAASILLGDQDLHPYNFGFIVTKEGDKTLFTATRVGTQNGLIGFNEYAFRDGKGSYDNLKDFFFAYKNFGFNLRALIDLEKLAEAFEAIAQIPDITIIDALNVKFNTLKTYGLITDQSTYAPFLDNTKYDAVIALHETHYNPLTPVEQWSVNPTSTEKLFEEAYAKQPTWLVNEAELTAFQQEILTRKNAAKSFADIIRASLKKSEL